MTFLLKNASFFFILFAIRIYLAAYEYRDNNDLFNVFNIN